MKSDIEKALSPLVGLPLWSAIRSLDLESFQFGARKKTTDRKGKEIEVGEYAVHTQCSWRIAGPSGIAVASGDRLVPRGNPDVIPDDFDCNQPGVTLCDERIETLLRERGESLVVERLEVGEFGSFSLSMRGGFKLDVFPDASTTEYWRLFQPRTGEHHFVVSATGIDDRR